MTETAQPATALRVSSTTDRRGVRTGRTVVVAVTLTALALAGCAKSSSTDSGGSTSSSTSALGSCGAVPTVAPKGDASLVSSLPVAQQKAYNGFTTPLAASTWANWKPKHAAPYKVAIAWQPRFNPFQTDTLAGLTKTLKASGKVDIVANVATTSLTDVPAQLQQFNQLVSRKPDLIIIEPLAAGPIQPAIAAAAKAGIPVISAWNVVSSADAVSVGVNNFLQAATLAAKVVVKMGGKGEVLKVHGIPGIPQDTDAQAGFDAVLKNCPNIKVAGQVTGNYSASDTKAATLQFLATHPGAIDGVMQSGTMTTGVIDAFTQLGRTVPAIADLGATKSSIAYAHAHKSAYQEFGTASADTSIGTTFARVAIAILAGAGPKVAQIITEPAYITSANLDAVYQNGWTTETAGDAAAPTDPFMTPSVLSSYFTRPTS